MYHASDGVIINSGLSYDPLQNPRYNAMLRYIPVAYRSFHQDLIDPKEKSKKKLRDLTKWQEYDKVALYMNSSQEILEKVVWRDG